MLGMTFQMTVTQSAEKATKASAIREANRRKGIGTLAKGLFCSAGMIQRKARTVSPIPPKMSPKADMKNLKKVKPEGGRSGLGCMAGPCHSRRKVRVR